MPRTTRPTEPSSKSTTLVGSLKPEQTPTASMAEMMVEGVAMNAVTAAGFSKNLGELDPAECFVALVKEAQRVNGGNLAGLEATLTAQVVALNAMFTQLAHHTSKMTIVDQIDRFTRLALKAQGQCRATVGTLALMKHPPTVFARQANIAHGPQQVNNGTPAPALARPEDKTAPTKLLEETHARMDAGTTGTPGRRDSAVAPLGARHRPAKRSG